MARIIGLTGSQNTGKTTLLRALQALNLPNIVVDDFSVARSVQNDYGKPLNEIISVADDVPEYQNRILTRKMERINELVVSYAYSSDNLLVFTDRTPIDFYAYAKTWVASNDKYSNWLETYRNECHAAMQQLEHVLFLPVRGFEFVYDIQRGSLKTQKAVHDCCVKFMDDIDSYPKITTITALSVEDRVKQVLDLFNK